eukprot:scaffold74156_cov51-Phaeocystis_antarctica.AAC.3
MFRPPPPAVGFNHQKLPSPRGTKLLRQQRRKAVHGTERSFTGFERYCPPTQLRRRNIDRARTDVRALATFTVSQSDRLKK